MKHWSLTFNTKTIYIETIDTLHPIQRAFTLKHLGFTYITITIYM